MTRRSIIEAAAAAPSAGTARRRRKEARPAELIEAGLAEFGARGFAAARMEDVARRAGVAKGTVFRYFPNKEALFEAAVTSRVAPVFGGALAALEAHDGPTMPLLRMLVTRAHQQLAESDLTVLMRVIIGEGHRFPAILAAYHRISISHGQALLARLVERGIARGEFRRNAIADLPMVLMAPMVMSAVWRLTFNAVDPIPPERFLAAHLDLIATGLACAEDAD
jgi:AcrR family transcriptional regulator